MTSFFPDVNVWLALSIESHAHSVRAWSWFAGLDDDSRLILCRYTQLGLLRLLTNPAVIAEDRFGLADAWTIYDRWAADDRVSFYPEPAGVDRTFRYATAQFSAQRAPNVIGDCYLLAFAHQSEAVLVTFDRALLRLATNLNFSAAQPE